jgi:DNA-binding GntR family transcriptional regulator
MTIDRVERYLRAQIILSDGMKRAHQEHLDILEACVARDATLAASKTRDHILGASETMIAILEKEQI